MGLSSGREIESDTERRSHLFHMFLRCSNCEKLSDLVIPAWLRWRRFDTAERPRTVRDTHTVELTSPEGIEAITLNEKEIQRVWRR